MKNKIKIGMGQLLIEGGEPERNLQRAHSMIEDASKNNCVALGLSSKPLFGIIL